MVEAAIAQGVSVVVIARAADVTSSSIYRWSLVLCGKPAGRGVAGTQGAIPIPGGARVWIATEQDDMRKGMPATFMF